MCFKCRPQRSNPDETLSKQAIEMYKTFWKMDPKKVGKMDADIPRRVHLAGPAVNVMYRSGKRDPMTLEKPKRALDYIHKHDKDVNVYRHDEDATGPLVDVPDFIRDAKEIVLLGQNLGFCYKDDTGTEIEAEPRRPYPELYTIPSGKALLVVQDKLEIVALIWGGRLDVEGRGIVH